MANLRETLTRRLTAAGTIDKRFIDPDLEQAKLDAVHAIHAAERAIGEADTRIADQAKEIELLKGRRLRAVEEGAGFDEADAAVLDAERIMRRLTLEREVAGKRHADATLELHNLAIAGNLKKMSRLIGERLAIAKEIESAVGTLADAVEKWYRLTAKLEGAIDPRLGRGTTFLCGRSQMYEALKAEFYRLSGNAPLGGSAKRTRLAPELPVAHCPRVEWLHQPEKITPLSVEIEKANAGLLSAMQTPPGQKPAAAPVTSSPAASAPTSTAAPVAATVDPETGHTVEIIRGAHLLNPKS